MRNLTPFFNALLVGERRGIVTLARLTKCPLLTPEERDHAGDVVLADEVRHARLIQSLIPSIPPPAVEPINLSDEEIIVRQPRVEALLVRCGPALYPDMTTEQVDVMKAIIEDEKGHVKWSLRIRDRLGLRTIRVLHRSPAVQLAIKALKSSATEVA